MKKHNQMHYNNLKIAIDSAILAGLAIMDIYGKPNFDLKIKDNNSPLTEADTAANIIINNHLIETGIPIISEENKNLEYSSRKHWERCWIVDPLDGTKEFIKKNGEFTVNIALCEYGTPKLGVIYVPVTKELYYADVAKGKAFKQILDEKHQLNENLFDLNAQILPATFIKNKTRVVGSRSHMNQETLDYIEQLKTDYNEVEIVSKGSSLKLCLVAEGKADVYPRFAPTMEWDTAAGHAICKAVGLEVLSKNTQKELSYNKENLLNHHFIVQKL